MAIRENWKPLAIAISVALAGGYALAKSLSDKDANPFEANAVDGTGGDKGEEGACGEGKCGGDKGAEGKCGEGKCGGDKGAEGKCGEGKCGGDEGEDGSGEHDKGEEGSCGEGKCGGLL